MKISEQDIAKGAGALLIGAIEAEFTNSRYSKEAKPALEQQLYSYSSVIQQNLADIIQRLRNEYTGTMIPKASMVLGAVRWVQARAAYAEAAGKVEQPDTTTPGKRPATGQEIDLLVRAYHDHGAAYAGKLSKWMESGERDYTEIDARLSPREQLPEDGLLSQVARVNRFF